MPATKFYHASAEPERPILVSGYRPETQHRLSRTDNAVPLLFGHARVDLGWPTAEHRPCAPLANAYSTRPQLPTRQDRLRHTGQSEIQMPTFAGEAANSPDPWQRHSTEFSPYPSSRRIRSLNTASACNAVGAVVNSGNKWAWRRKRHLSTASMQWSPVVGSGSGKSRSRSSDRRASNSKTERPSRRATTEVATSPRVGMRRGRVTRIHPLPHYLPKRSGAALCQHQFRISQFRQPKTAARQQAAPADQP